MISIKLGNDMASLTEQISHFMTEHAQRAPERFALIRQVVTRMQQEGVGRSAPRVGDRVADFALPDALGRSVSLSSRLANGPVVLTFYRGGWCPYCNLQLRSLQGALGEIRALGASVMAVSPQPPDESLSTAEKNTLSFDVLSDLGSKIIRQWKLAYEVDEILREPYLKAGFDLPAINGSGDWVLPITATYLIDKDYRIAWARVDEDHMVRAETTELLDKLRALIA
jgi:peroxiredoxin